MLSNPVSLVLFIIAVALFFDFINGFHDAANSITTVVGTRVLTPGQARSTMKAVNLSPSAWAKTISMSGKPPLLIHIFSPLRRQDPSG